MGTNPPKPLEVLSDRVRSVRRKRGLTAQQLADKLTELGVSWDRGAIAKLETGRRRTVTIEEVFALAYALNVSPLTLLTPEDENALYAITPTKTLLSSDVGRWISGHLPEVMVIPDGEDVFDQPWIDWVRELPPWRRAEYEEIFAQWRNGK